MRRAMPQKRVVARLWNPLIWGVIRYRGLFSC